MQHFILLTALLSLLLLCHPAQAALLSPQNDTFNSTFRLTTAQITAANLSNTIAHNVEVALNFERSNNAGGLTQDDPFYSVPTDYDYADPPPPGTVLKVEEHTNISLYTLPMSLSMSRILYVSELLGGSSVPASAYVLWPYLPRSFPGKLTTLSGCNSTSAQQPIFPVIGLAHGTSGQTQACAPSGLRNLWDDFHNPFPLALAGYAVVAPDYVGLGVPNITSPYFILPSQANDLLHAVAAAQTQWPDALSREFVVAGQSQGGGVAWATAQNLASRPVEGYLGTVAASPFTDVLAAVAADAMFQNNARITGIAQGLSTVLPNFTLSDWLTDQGIARWELLHSIKGCGLTGAQLFSDPDNDMLRPGWNATPAAAWYRHVSTNGGNRPFAGPMLVLQGTEDPNANEPVTTASVRETCAAFPEAELRYVRTENITHVPVLYAYQHGMVDWIAARFAGGEVKKGCVEEVLRPARGAGEAGFGKAWGSQDWFVEFDVFGV